MTLYFLVFKCSVVEYFFPVRCYHSKALLPRLHAAILLEAKSQSTMLNVRLTEQNSHDEWKKRRKKNNNKTFEIKFQVEQENR